MARNAYGFRPRRWPIVLLIIVGLLAVVMTVASQFWVDVLWYREVHLSSVFWTVLRTKGLLTIVFGIVFSALLFANLWFVRATAPTTRIITPDLEVVERARQTIEPYLWWLFPAVLIVLGLVTGVGVSRQWQTFLLWRHSTGITFGTQDPVFHRDAGFYVFTLPWLRFVQGWLFSSLVGITFLTGIAHFLWGGIRPQAEAFADKVSAPVRGHLSVLFAAIMLTKAWGYWLGRFDLLTSSRGVVEGASYTDVHAQLPALKVLAFVAIICAILFGANVWRKVWALPIIAVGILGIVSVVLGAAIPAFVQAVNVKPQERQRETPYIQRNIDATRTAFGLDGISLTPLEAASSVTPDELLNNKVTISNIRLWRQRILEQNFQSLQRIRQYYEFGDVDVDRYSINGQERVLMVAARQISQNGIPAGSQTWQNQHLYYTHGFGAVASEVSSATPEGAPVFDLSDIPPTGEIPVTQPRIYYGEKEDVPFVMVKTGTPELDYEGAASPQAYTGQGGIPIGNLFQRALFAWRYRDVNLLISSQVHSDSKILIRRDIETRATLPVPFLTFDHDPYLAVVDGRLVWIWDAYTTTSQYPYSQSIDLSSATNDGLSGSVNYMRNSVKVTMDAYDGTLHYYVTDPTDPIIQVWRDAFPGLFTDGSLAPADLRAHFRYPENLFQVQATQFARYHVTDPTVFFGGQDRWQIPQDPTYCANTPNATACDQTNPSGSIPQLDPYYLLMQLPGESTEQFVLVTPFTPLGRLNMVGFMAAKSDPADYGQRVAFTFPAGRNVFGPEQAFSQINQDPTFSQDRTLFGQSGSTVLFGDLLVIPVGNSFLYVQPVYIRSAQQNAIPELKRVIIVNGETVGVGATLQEALANATGGQTGGGKPVGGTTDQQIQTLLQQALDHFQAANDALKAGDLATYQSELATAQDLVRQANDLAGQAPSTPTSPSPSAPPSPG